MAAKKGYDLVVDVGNRGDDIDKNSRLVNLNAEAYQKLHFAAMRENVASEVLDKSLIKLNKNVGAGGIGKKLAQEMTEAKVKTQSYQQVVGTSAGKLSELRKQLAGVESSLRKNRAEFAETEAGFTDTPTVWIRSKPSKPSLKKRTGSWQTAVKR